MPLSDYAHHNEEARRIWWEEEGRHADEPREPDYDRDAYGPADAFAEEMAELNDDDLRAEYELQSNPDARQIIKDELANRGLTP